MNQPRTALIIGGGIAGATAALALKKASLGPVIYEAYEKGAEGTGAFLTLATNGIDALRVLDADQCVLKRGFPTPNITLRSGTGKYLGRTATGLALPDGTMSQTIKRGDLYQALQNQVRERGITIVPGKKLVAAEDLGDAVRATFADGSTAMGHVLVGCDGVHSVTRAVIDSRAPSPRYSGLLTTGGYVRGVPVESEPGTYVMIFGAKAFFGYVLATDGEVWWFANVPQTREPARGETQSIAEDERRRLLRGLFSRDAGPACALIDATPEVTPLTPIHTMPPLPRWHRSRMIVIGDAAHAPSPTSGQGASLSIEDGLLLALCLRDSADPEAAFTRFETERRPRVERIVKWAARINSSKAPGPVGRLVRDAVLPTILSLTANSVAHRRTFEYHIDWTARASLKTKEPAA